MSECLFNVWLKIPDGLATNFGVKAAKSGDLTRKCQRCGDQCRLLITYGSNRQYYGAFTQVNRPMNCNGETHP